MNKEIKFLSGSRFSSSANDDFIMDRNFFEQHKENMDSPEMIEKIENFIISFISEQLPRLKELKRYYLSDNNIKYRETGRDKNRADNKISSDWAKYVTTFMQGYILGNPVVYDNEDEGLLEKINDFQKKNNEDYHNGLLEIDLSIYGRAFELAYSDEYSKPKLVKLAAENTFVVYDDSISKNSLFGVRIYQIEYSDTNKKSFVDIYTANKIYYYQANNLDFSGLAFNSEEDNYFGGVPITEYRNNEERTGDFEAVLDSIDAYDLSQSELANFQQDMNDAYLVIVGNPMTGTAAEYELDENGETKLDEYGQPIEVPNSTNSVLSDMMKARMLILDNNNDPDGPTPTAYYLTKTYDTTGAEAYKGRLVDDILRFTFTPDTSDQNFSGVQSGESMKYKLMGNDNLTKTKIRLLTKGIMRRLRLLANFWKIGNATATSGKLSEGTLEEINDTTVKFTPNIPQNEDDKVAVIKQLYGIVSDETLLTMLAPITGVDAESELNNLKEEKKGVQGADSLNNDFSRTQKGNVNGQE
jgi:SPP1 family phage portal protein